MTFSPGPYQRRLRYNPGIKDLVRENHIHLDCLIYPLFVSHGKKIKKEVSTMPGCYPLSKDLLHELKESIALGIKTILLFGLPAHKDNRGSDTWRMKSNAVNRGAIWIQTIDSFGH
ncbi:hypothetical protein [Legionella erythra]|uniref:Delta-aminolevulinic acid dehydratase n=1 Tax=Legionella erythra TaxID=448 RepID=A0A0W0TQD6_LEGER|nr:hypothetical protein [Legionella erythra]KTC97809.1 delta-aminolevulinic acid dehydratase [Legionella erythra]